MHEKLPLFSARQPRPHDFFCEGLVRNAELLPWYHVNVQVLQSETTDHQVLMIPTLDALKEVLKQEGASFTIESIDYVTPGYMNESGQWMMERMLEITELFNAGGWSIPRCKMKDGRIYRALSLEPQQDWGNEQVLYTARKNLR